MQIFREMNENFREFNANALTLAKVVFYDRQMNPSMNWLRKTKINRSLNLSIFVVNF